MFGFGKEDDIVIKISSDIKEALVGIRKVDVAIDKMDANVGKAAAGIRGATGKMIKAFVAVGAVAAVGLAVGIGKATMTFADFEQAVTNAASVTGQTGAAYEATKRNIEELSKTLGETTVFSAQQAANAMYDLASAGYDVGTMVKSDLEPIMNLAAATQSDLTFATETVTSALGQFGMGINDSLRVSDVFAKAVGDSKSKMESLSVAMRTVGPTAHSMGIDIESTTAYLGTLFDAGLKGEQAATGLKGAFGKLAAPTNAAAAALADIGLTVEEVNPLTNDFTSILETLNGAGIDASDMFKIFGQEGWTRRSGFDGSITCKYRGC
jgi:TP901 family phage tail tape measure protein